MADYVLHQGDALAVLRSMPDESVQCCVTSPPYYRLRDYRVPGQIGLEETPAAYVAKLVEVFEEVRRVLKPDGTAWVNLGDSYNANQGSGFNAHQYTRPHLSGENVGQKRIPASSRNTVSKGFPNWKPKDLMGIPWRVAFALQDAGWWLRQDIIWAKPNPMPESVTDRCTKAHEYIFLLAKSAKYFYDGEAIKEPVTESSVVRLSQDVEGQKGSDRVPGKTNGAMKAVASWKGSNFHTGKTAIHQLERSLKNRDRSIPRNRNGITGSLDAWGSKNVAPKGQTPHSMHLSRLDGTADEDFLARNKRSVWTVTTQPYSEAHFATFPPKLIEPMILAGSREGDTVLDPFNGAGTTGLVSLRHKRNYIGIELNPEYIEISRRRLAEVQVNLF